MNRISIVINNYNYERYLPEAIDSALAQTYPECEVIIVDDGSTDGSRSIIEGYGELVRAIFKENGGQATAFNVGIEAAKGDYILLLDADDVLLPNAVEDALLQMDADVVRLCYGLQRIDAHGQAQGGYPLKGPARFKGSMKDALLDHAFFPGTPTSGNLFRAKELKRCLPVPAEKFRISADLYLFCENAKYGPLQRIDQELALYRVHGSNNFASAQGRFGITEKQLRNNVENLINSRDLLVDYSKGMPAAERRDIEAYVMTTRSMELISDARMRRVVFRGEDKWDSRRVLSYALRGVSRGKSAGAKLRNAIGLGTICINEYTPTIVAMFFYRLLGKVLG